MVAASIAQHGGAEAPAPALRIRTTSHEECLAALEAAGVSVRYNQMTKGPFSAEIDLITVSPALRFSQSCYSAAMTSQGACPSGSYAFFLPLTSPQGLFFDQQPLDLDEVAVVRPGEEFCMVRPARFGASVVWVERDMVEQRCAEVHGASAPTLLASGTRLRMDRAALTTVKRQFAHVAEQAGSPRAKNLSEQLVDGLLGAIEKVEPRRGWSQRKRLLERAWAMVEDDETELHSVGQLCAALGVPIRTLDDAFRTGLGITPKHFLTGMRLNKVRRQLLSPGAAMTVTEAATRLHFYHFGHFGQQYRALFGESPSETLRRSRATSRLIARRALSSGGPTDTHSRQDLRRGA